MAAAKINELSKWRRMGSEATSLLVNELTEDEESVGADALSATAGLDSSTSRRFFRTASAVAFQRRQINSVNLPR